MAAPAEASQSATAARRWHNALARWSCRCFTRGAEEEPIMTAMDRVPEGLLSTTRMKTAARILACGSVGHPLGRVGAMWSSRRASVNTWNSNGCRGGVSIKGRALRNPSIVSSGADPVAMVERRTAAGFSKYVRQSIATIFRHPGFLPDVAAIHLNSLALDYSQSPL